VALVRAAALGGSPEDHLAGAAVEHEQADEDLAVLAETAARVRARLVWFRGRKVTDVPLPD
jgi:hypothetical protein